MPLKPPLATWYDWLTFALSMLFYPADLGFKFLNPPAYTTCDCYKLYMLFSAPWGFWPTLGVYCVVTGSPAALLLKSCAPVEPSVTNAYCAKFAFLNFLMSNLALFLASLSMSSSKAVIWYMLSLTVLLWWDLRELKLFAIAPGFLFYWMVLSLLRALSKFCLSSLSC